MKWDISCEVLVYKLQYLFFNDTVSSARPVSAKTKISMRVLSNHHVLITCFPCCVLLKSLPENDCPFHPRSLARLFYAGAMQTNERPPIGKGWPPIGKGKWQPPIGKGSSGMFVSVV